MMDFSLERVRTGPVRWVAAGATMLLAVVPLRADAQRVHQGPAPLPAQGGVSTPRAPGARQRVEDAEIVAIVGDTPILAGEVLPQVREILDQAKGQLPPEELAQQKRLMMQRFLEQRIQLRVLYQAFLKSLPEKQRKDVLEQIDKQLNQKFYTEQLPKLLERTKAKSAAELDAMLRKYGSSIEQQKKDFQEQAVARMMVQQHVKRDEEVTHEELLSYYLEHLEEYEFPARARWEKLTVKFDKFPDKAAADRAIVEMGNMVLRGVPFKQVAKQYSQGLMADAGGYHDWTSQGSLVSDVLDRAIFSLPIGKLSRVLEDEEGFHIVRVIERTPAGRKPFEEVQEEIKQKIRDARFQKNLEEYLEKVRRETYVWSVFDDASDQAGTADGSS